VPGRVGPGLFRTFIQQGKKMTSTSSIKSVMAAFSVVFSAHALSAAGDLDLSFGISGYIKSNATFDQINSTLSDLISIQC
jgi:hypothetical protein